MHRVLKDDGILAFTYHHSRAEGWYAVLKALLASGFTIKAAHPIKSEMSVAIPKHMAKEPIDLDIIIVCRKRSRVNQHCKRSDLWDEIASVATSQVLRLRSSGRKLSRSDVRIVVMAQLLRQLSTFEKEESALPILESSSQKIEGLIDGIVSRPDELQERW